MTEIDTSAHSVLLIGGPDSGKTNFVVRLWLAIKAETGTLRSNGLPEHLEALEVGAQRQLRGEFAGHTAIEVYNENIIPCRTNVAGDDYEGSIVIPDCSGERWNGIYRSREWSSEWEDKISDDCSCLVFVRAGSDQIVAPLDWVQCEHLWGGPGQEATPGGRDDAPTQVVLVEFLQFLAHAFRRRAGGDFRPRIGLVVAAWDRVPADLQGEGPRAYLAREFPLLDQFIRSNDDEFEFAHFGVSIAGGDFKLDQDFRAQCMATDDPLAGGYVIHEMGGKPAREADLTLPVAWALGLWPPH